ELDYRLVVTTAGAPPSPTTILQMEQMGFRIVHVYGLTETYGPYTVNQYRLQQRLTTTVASAAPVTTVVAETPVDDRTLPVLAPPLRGEGYLAADGCCGAVRHTRAALPLNGSSWLSQRFAIDYEQVDAENRIYVGPRQDPRSYHIYGDEILAVADGTVVTSHDGQAEEVPGKYPEPDLLTADGNYVVLDIGGGNYVTYAHMQTGSVRVQVGQEVRTGDVLGLVGNSGNTIVPHLHIQVTDGPTLASSGLPYLISEYTLTGRIAGTEAFDTAESDGTPAALVPGIAPTVFRDRLVLDQGIVTFP
uniref:M23 family metallopeptidase n=1 Tax=Pseudonocardia pini TaxID=2758030 RepID=UPI0015F0A15A